MHKKPWQQGHFDGYCGLYSLINAVDYLHPEFTEDDCEKLFACLVRASDFVDHVMLNGLDFEPLCTVAESVPGFLKGRSTIRFIRPFVVGEVESTDEFLDALAPMLGPNRVAIIGLGEPWDHWSVASKITKRTVFFRDSYGIKRFRRAEFVLAATPGKIELDFHETIIIERL